MLAIRSHVDICDDRLLAVDALLALREAMKPYLDLQLVAFPQDGYLRYANCAANLDAASKLRRRRRRRHPPFRAHHGRGRARRKRRSCRIAAERGLMVDMHCDESDDPLSRHVETFAAETVRHGLQRPGDGLASHLDAFDGQLLRQQAHPADAPRRNSMPSPIR